MAPRISLILKALKEAKVVGFRAEVVTDLDSVGCPRTGYPETGPDEVLKTRVSVIYIEVECHCW